MEFRRNRDEALLLGGSVITASGIIGMSIAWVVDRSFALFPGIVGAVMGVLMVFGAITNLFNSNSRRWEEIVGLEKSQDDSRIGHRKKKVEPPPESRSQSDNK